MGYKEKAHEVGETDHRLWGAAESQVGRTHEARDLHVAGTKGVKAAHGYLCRVFAHLPAGAGAMAVDTVQSNSFRKHGSGNKGANK